MAAIAVRVLSRTSASGRARNASADGEPCMRTRQALDVLASAAWAWIACHQQPPATQMSDTSPPLHWHTTGVSSDHCISVSQQRSSWCDVVMRLATDPNFRARWPNGATPTSALVAHTGKLVEHSRLCFRLKANTSQYHRFRFCYLCDVP